MNSQAESNVTDTPKGILTEWWRPWAPCIACMECGNMDLERMWRRPTGEERYSKGTTSGGGNLDGWGSLLQYY